MLGVVEFLEASLFFVRNPVVAFDIYLTALRVERSSSKDWPILALEDVLDSIEFIFVLEWVIFLDECLN